MNEPRNGFYWVLWNRATNWDIVWFIDGRPMGPGSMEDFAEIGERIERPTPPESPQAPKPDLNLSTPPKAQMHAMIEAADSFNSDLAQIIGRDRDNKLLFVSVFAKGDEAVALERWLNRKGRP